MKNNFFPALLALAVWGCGKAQPATTANNNTHTAAITAKIEDIFLELPADVWVGLPAELQFLSQRNMREKVLKNEDFEGCEGEKKCDCRVFKEGTKLYISELPLPKGVKGTETEDGGEMGTITISRYNQFYLTAQQRKDGKYVVLLSNHQQQNGDTDFTSQLSDAKVWIAHSRLYDPQNKEWSNYPIAEGKTFMQLLEKSDCCWLPDYLPYDEQGNEYPPSWSCACSGMPETARTLSWTGDGYEVITRDIPADTYGGN